VYQCPYKIAHNANIGYSLGLSSAFKSLLAGGVGGMCTVLVGHPLDLIKVRMQTAHEAKGTQFPSVLFLLRETSAAEGLAGLYRGVSAPLAAIVPIYAVSFWSYNMGQHLILYYYARSSAHTDLTVFQKCISGALSAIPTTLIVAPAERIKCLIQARIYHGSVWSCAGTISTRGH
jgi:solute carrier family 25 (mitochondrial carnitine/acylcarnitine transporter), member 20/29